MHRKVQTFLSYYFPCFAEVIRKISIKSCAFSATTLKIFLGCV